MQLYAQRMEPKLRRALRAQTRESVRRVRAGQDPIPRDFNTRWQDQIFAAMLKDGVGAAMQGWSLVDRQHFKAPDPTDPEILIGIGDAGEGFDDFTTMPTKQSVAQYLWDTAGDSADLHASTIDAIMAQLRDEVVDDAGTLRGLTSGEFAKRLMETFETWDQNYARMLARTTTSWTENEGAMGRYQQAGVKKVQWYATADELTCPFCRELHGKVIAIGDPFLGAGDTMTGTVQGADGKNREVSMRGARRATQHPPVHPNCRCTLLPVITEMGSEVPPLPAPAPKPPQPTPDPVKPKPKPKPAPKPVEPEPETLPPETAGKTEAADQPFETAEEWRQWLLQRDEEIKQETEAKVKKWKDRYDEAFAEWKEALRLQAAAIREFGEDSIEAHDFTAARKRATKKLKKAKRDLSKRDLSGLDHIALMREELHNPINQNPLRVHGIGQKVEYFGGDATTTINSTMPEAVNVRFNETVGEVSKFFSESAAEKLVGPPPPPLGDRDYPDDELEIEAMEERVAPFSMKIRKETDPTAGGSYDSIKDVMRLRNHSHTSTIAHEFGHAIGSKNNVTGTPVTGGYADTLARDFYRKRTAGEEITWDGSYEVKRDRWMNTYTGRVYRKASWDDVNDPHGVEVMSTGIEQLYENPSKFAREDPDFFNFIISVVKDVEYVEGELPPLDRIPQPEPLPPTFW